MIRPNRIAIAAVAILTLAAGCASGPNPIVVDARQRVAATENDPKTEEHAEVAVYEAKRALDRLERAERAGASEKELEHLAYLVDRKLEVARAAADRSMLRASLGMLGDRRDRIRLDARSREVESERVRALTAEQRLVELEGELEALRSQKTDRGLVLTLSDILFPLDEAALKPGGQRVLDRVAHVLAERPEQRVLVEGHTDGLGSGAYNRSLSRRRADAVANYLVRRGVQPDRVTTRGWGESAPVASNDTPAGRQQNRRVEIILPN